MRRQVKEPLVRHELLPEQSTALLKELHLLTRDGHLNADSLRKLKQVNHLVGLLTPALEDIHGRFGNPVLVDAGSGNGYLPFVLYELFLQPWGAGEMICVEPRKELCDRATERARKLGFNRLRFICAPIGEAVLPDRIQLLTALHACDTATDDALFAGLKRNADHLAVVPCCQAEVAALLKEHRTEANPLLQALFDHPWHRREFGSHLTNVFRALALQAQGYSVTVTELTGWEHSLKNELILGKKVRKDDRQAQDRLTSLVAQTAVEPALVRLLSRNVAPLPPVSR